MNRLLRNQDYNRIIQSGDLDQITEGNWDIVYECEQVAQAEISSYIAKRYDITQIFTDTTLFDISKAYKSEALVYVSAPAFIPGTGSTYSIGDRVVFSGTNGTDYIYYNVSGYTGTSASTDTYDTNFWTGGTLEDNSLFFVTPPAKAYDVDGDYRPGDIVIFKDTIYISSKVNNNRWLKEDWEGQVNSQTGTAVIPGYSHNWKDYWSATTINYNVTGVQPDTDTTGVWTRGDNRNQIVIQNMMNIILYYMHVRINPRNIPEIRMIMYDGNNPTQNGGAIGWLKKVNQGQLQLDEPELIPTNGQSIYWTSEMKRRMNY